MNNKNQNSTDYTFYIPFSWMDLILNEELLPLFNEVYLDKEEYMIMGWNISFSTEDGVLNLHLYDAVEAMQTGDAPDDDWFMDFSIEEITLCTWKEGEIGDDKIRIRCIWIKDA